LDYLAGLVRMDLSKGTRDYQYNADGLASRQAASDRGLAGIKLQEKYELLPSLLPCQILTRSNFS
jgi:hypothetical protein